MLKNPIKTIIFILLSFTIIACTQQEKKPSLTIGIIEPIDHVAIHEIVRGFTDSFHEVSNNLYKIKIENAQNDMNLQRAIIEKMKNANYDVIVPIGTTATQMVVNMTKSQTIISLAANLSEEERKSLKNCNLAIVHDEISSKQIFLYVKKVYPDIHNILLIHSAANNILPQVDETIKAGKSLGIKVDHRMVTSLSELYTLAQSLSDQYQAIFILKDNLIASGASTLATVAKRKNIPFIASDEGSVKSGADFALGVHEKEIGSEGAKLLQAVLAGKKACDLPIIDMIKLSVFVNPRLNNNAMNAIHDAAKELQYNIISSKDN